MNDDPMPTAEIGTHPAGRATVQPQGLDVAEWFSKFRLSDAEVVPRSRP